MGIKKIVSIQYFIKQFQCSMFHSPLLKILVLNSESFERFWYVKTSKYSVFYEARYR